MKIKVQQLVEALERAYTTCEEYLEEHSISYYECSCPASTVCYPFSLDKVINLKFPCGLDVSDLLILREWCNERCHCDQFLNLACFCSAISYGSKRNKCVARWCRPFNYDVAFGLDVYKEEFIFDKDKFVNNE